MVELVGWFCFSVTLALRVALVVGSYCHHSTSTRVKCVMRLATALVVVALVVGLWMVWVKALPWCMS